MDLSTHFAPLAKADQAFQTRYPGDTGKRQPVHTVYGGAHLFKAATPRKLGELALKSLEAFGPDPSSFSHAVGIPEALAETVYARVREKLEREPVEDFRIDFEDGFGNRPDAEEDATAIAAAKAVAEALTNDTLSPFIGIRIKPLTEELRNRSARTLELFVTQLVESTGGTLPSNFVVTLPKVTIPAQVTALVGMLEELERTAGLDTGALKLELMIEMPQAIIGPDGTCPLPSLASAADGRCTGAHFGTYDYTAGCSIIADHQHMMHPACDYAKHAMQVAFAGTGIWISDGATNVMPVGDDAAVVHNAWKLHYTHVMHSLVGAFYQGWDLHPAQLPTRYAAVYTFFLEGLDSAGQRLRNFIEKAAQATLVGDVFDDAATGQGLLNFFLRAVNCGAVTEDEAVKLSGLSVEELRGRSFVKILSVRSAHAPGSGEPD